MIDSILRFPSMKRFQEVIEEEFTNHSPEGIDYIIPGNDDSSKAVTLYTRGIADAILDGRANAVQEVMTAIKEGEEEFVEEGKVE